MEFFETQSECFRSKKSFLSKGYGLKTRDHDKMSQF